MSDVVEPRLRSAEKLRSHFPELSSRRAPKSSPESLICPAPPKLASPRAHAASDNASNGCTAQYPHPVPPTALTATRTLRLQRRATPVSNCSAAPSALQLGLAATPLLPCCVLGANGGDTGAARGSQPPVVNRGRQPDWQLHSRSPLVAPCSPLGPPPPGAPTHPTTPRAPDPPTATTATASVPPDLPHGPTSQQCPVGAQQQQDTGEPVEAPDDKIAW